MRLIDADALHRKVKTETNPYGKPTIDYDSGVKVLGWIDKAPTIDAVPVVRCLECKHCDPETHHCDHHMGTVAPLRRKPYDFCSYGERKEGKRMRKSLCSDCRHNCTNRKNKLCADFKGIWCNAEYGRVINRKIKGCKNYISKDKKD